MEGNLFLPSKELLLQLLHHRRRDHGLRGRRGPVQIKKQWLATMIKGKQCQSKPYLVDDVSQWAPSTVRI
jgi:hypothetical protein